MVIYYIKISRSRSLVGKDFLLSTSIKIVGRRRFRVKTVILPKKWSRRGE